MLALSKVIISHYIVSITVNNLLGKELITFRP